MRFILFLLVFTLPTACSGPGGEALQLDAAATQAMLEKDPSVPLIDLRTPAELRETGKIAGARAINFNSPDFESQIKQLDREKPVIVYCAAGSRSARAQERMSGWGFKKVYNYTGGMNDWKARGNATVPEQ